MNATVTLSRIGENACNMWNKTDHAFKITAISQSLSYAYAVDSVFNNCTGSASGLNAKYSSYPLVWEKPSTNYVFALENPSTTDNVHYTFTTTWQFGGGISYISVLTANNGGGPIGGFLGFNFYMHEEDRTRLISANVDGQLIQLDRDFNLAHSDPSQ